MRPITIGLTGKARSGKSTVAEILRDQHGFTIISFADTLREMALAIDPIIGADMGELVWLSELVGDSNGWERAKDEWPEVRRFLQRLGTDGVRNHLGQSAWVDAWRSKADAASGSVVAADIRFDNEASAVHEFWDAEVWRIERPGLVDPSGAAGHTSENGIADHLVTRKIVNNGNLSDLAAKVAALTSQIGSRRPEDASPATAGPGRQG